MFIRSNFEFFYVNSNVIVLRDIFLLDSIVMGLYIIRLLIVKMCLVICDV